VLVKTSTARPKIVASRCSLHTLTCTNLYKYKTLLQAQEAVASMKQRQAMITHDLLGKLSGSAADADLLRHKLDVSQTDNSFCKQ
jgi:hypothetical protein